MRDSLSDPPIEIVLTEEGRALFADITRQHSGERIAIIIDGRVLSAPVIASEIAGGQMAISGNFTEEEAVELVHKLNAAAQRYSLKP